MISVFSQYLDSVRNHLRLDRTSESEVINELRSHLEDGYDEMRESGLTEYEAANACIRLLGSAKLVAQQLYEAHSQGSWKHALLSSIPHMLFALLFVLNWWQGVEWIVITLAIIFAITLYGWLHGKPIWLFSWLGYALIPLIITGLLFLYLPKVLSWIAIVVYIPFTLWLFYSITMQTIKRDWLFSILTLLPLPIIIGWQFAVRQEGKFLEISTAYMAQYGHFIGLSFFILAVIAVIFIRVRKRWIIGSLLIASQFSLLIMVTLFTKGKVGISEYSILLLLIICVISILIFINRKFRYGHDIKAL